MQLADLNFKPHARKSLRNIIGCAIGSCFYPPPGSVKYKLLCFDQFHGPPHINCDQNDKCDIKKTKISNACNHTTNPCVAQI